MKNSTSVKNFRMVPSVAVPISFKDIIFSLIGVLKNDIIKVFEKKISGLTGFGHCILYSNARTGLTDLLKILSNNKKRKEVIIPSYTCPSVLFSVKRAGLQPVLAEVDVKNLNMIPEKIGALICKDTLAIVVVHMFGKMAETKKISQIIKNQNIDLIEDAATATDFYKDNKMHDIGKHADFCLFSFGKSKIMTTIEGGALLCRNDEVYNSLKEIQRNVSNASLFKKVWLLLTLFIFSIAINPYFFYWIDKMSLLSVESDFTKTPPNYRFTKIQAALGIQMLRKLSEMNKIRISNGRILYSKIKKFKNFNIQDVEKNLYARFTLVCPDQNSRDTLFQLFRKAGIWASKTTYNVLDKLDQTIKNPNDNFYISHRIADTILTLPTHPLVKLNDIEKMVSIIFKYNEEC